MRSCTAWAGVEAVVAIVVAMDVRLRSPRDRPRRSAFNIDLQQHLHDRVGGAAQGLVTGFGQKLRKGLSQSSGPLFGKFKLRNSTFPRI